MVWLAKCVLRGVGGAAAAQGLGSLSCKFKEASACWLSSVGERLVFLRRDMGRSGVSPLGRCDRLHYCTSDHMEYVQTSDVCGQFFYPESSRTSLGASARLIGPRADGISWYDLLLDVGSKQCAFRDYK